MEQEPVSARALAVIESPLNQSKKTGNKLSAVKTRNFFVRNVSTVHQQIASGFSCVSPVTDHEFRYNIAKVAVDPFLEDF